jgi:hypothetical protein
MVTGITNLPSEVDTLTGKAEAYSQMDCHSETGKWFLFIPQAEYCIGCPEYCIGCSASAPNHRSPNQISLN